MNLEALMRQVAITSSSTGELRPADLPPNSFLKLGGGALAAAPAFAHGMITRSTALASGFGLWGSIETVAALAATVVRRGPGGPVIAVIGAPADPPSISSGNTLFHFGPGSVWLASSLLTAQAPADGFMGVKVTGIDLTVPGSQSGGDIVIGAADIATLSITPGLPNPASGFVNDGTTTSAVLPSQIDFQLAPGGIVVVRLDDATFTTLGTTVTLGGGTNGTAWDGAAREIVLGYTSIDPATFTASGSSIFGQAPTIAGQYRLPVAQATPDALGEAATGGVPTAVVSAGLAWRFGDKPVRLGPAQVLAEQGSLGIRALLVERSFKDAFTMWNAPDTNGNARLTGLTFTVPADAILALAESARVESRLAFGAAMQAAIDRPLTVANTPIALDHLIVDYSVVRTPDTTTLNVLGLPPPPGGPQPPVPQVFAIENALLRTDGVVQLNAAMTLNGTQATSGLLIAGMALRDLLPILPDPYVSNDPILQRPRLSAGILAEVGWATPGTPGFGFTLLPPNPPPQSTGVTLLQPWGQWEALLDVSGRADQFGIFMLPDAPLTGQIAGQVLQLPGEEFGVFTVPHIAWEAVISDSTLNALGQPVPAPRQWFPPFANGDGEPARLAFADKTLVPTEPLAAVDRFVAAYRSGEAAAMEGFITLPFGLTAAIEVFPKPQPPAPPTPPTLDVIRATFAGFAAGLQIRLTAGVPPSGSPALPGFSIITDPYPQGLLPAQTVTAWNGQFQGGFGTHIPPPPGLVPLSGIDLSGYGASMFSRWQNPNDAGTGIQQVRFDVVVGRTTYELVQSQSWVVPARVRVVETTIFERDADGYVIRHDSGWQPMGNGEFTYEQGTPETGGVVRLASLRNIHPTGQPAITTPDGITYQPVAFDADVVIDPAGVQPASGQTSLPTTGMVGYLRLTAKNDPPTLLEVATLLAQVAAVGAAAAAGPVAAEAEVTGTGFRFSLTGIDVQPMAQLDGSAPTNIAVALRGTPNLPRDGAWSVTRRTPTDTAAKPVDPHLPVPLVRLRAAPAQWHVVEPSELAWVAAGQEPPTKFGFLQSTGTQKMLLEHPQLIGGASPPLQTGQVPGLADIGALLGIPGLLPDMNQLLQLAGPGGLSGLQIAGDGFRTDPVSVTLALPETGLILLGPVAVELATASEQLRPITPPEASGLSTIRVTLDATAAPGQRWSVTIDRVAFKLIVAGFGDANDPLVAVTGTLIAHEGRPPSFDSIQVRYGQVLQTVTQVLQGIETAAQFLPGSVVSFKVDFAGTTLRIRENFTLPTLPLGLGFLQNIGLDMGFDIDVLSRTLHFSVGVGSDQDPFDWLVSPLAGNGLISLGAQDKLGVRMQAGVGAGLGIDLAIASGSASVTLAVQIDTTQSPFILLVVLTGNASVDVLDGLASASLTLSAGVGVGVDLPPPPPVPPSPQDLIDFAKNTRVTLEAQVAVGIHLSVCWLVHVDWTGFWPFKETVTGAALTGLLP